MAAEAWSTSTTQSPCSCLHGDVPTNDQLLGSLLQAQPPVGRNTIRLFQTHDAAGRPAPAEFTQVITHRSVNTLGSDAMLFLAPLHPRRTAHAGVFTYTDPQRGSGWLRLEEFGRGDADRIQELVHMEEIVAVVGPEPRRNTDLRYGNALVLRTHNPWVMYGMGVVSLLCALGMISATLRGFSVGETTALVVMGGIFILLSLAFFVRASIRLPWWTRARRYAREHGGVLPADIKGL